MKRDAAACGPELVRHHRMGFRVDISCLLPITCVHLQTNVLPALQGRMHPDPGRVSGHHRAHWGQKHRRSYRLGSDASKREEERRRTASGGTREEQNGLFLRSFQGTVKVVGMNPYIAVVTRILCSIIYGLLVNQFLNSRWKHHLLPHRAKGACEAGMTSITQRCPVLLSREQRWAVSQDVSPSTTKNSIRSRSYNQYLTSLIHLSERFHSLWPLLFSFLLRGL